MALCHKRIKQEKFRESKNFEATSLDSSSARKKRESLTSSAAQITTTDTTTTTLTTRSLQDSKQFTHSPSHHTDPAVSHRCPNEADRLSPKADRVASKAAGVSLQSVSQRVRVHSSSPNAKEKAVNEKTRVGVTDSAHSSPPFDPAKNCGGLKSTVQQQQQQQQPRPGAKIGPLSTKSEGTIPEFPVLNPISSSVLKTVVKKESNEQMPPDQKNIEDKMKCLSDDLYEEDGDDVIITEVALGKRKKKDDFHSRLLVEGKFSFVIPDQAFK